MNADTPQGRAAFWLALVGLLLADLWLGWDCWTQQDQATAAQRQLHQLGLIANEIEILRQAPVRVDEGARTSDAIAQIVETAAKQVQLNPERIVHIDPGEPRRLEDSEYLEQRTAIELREVTLRQVVEFTIALEGTGTGMEVATLALRVPTGLEIPMNSEELWNAQLLLTSRIYKPKIPAANSLRSSD